MKKIVAVFASVIIVATVVFAGGITAAAEDHEFMEIRETKLNAEISGNKIPKEAFSDQSADGKNENTRLTKSAVGITNNQMFRVTRTTGDTDADNSLRRLATVYTDRKSTTGAEAYMYYLEIPEDVEDPVVEYSWNLYDGDSNDQKNGHIYSGTVYYLLKGSKTWVPTTISNRFFTLPTGFKGFLLFKPTESSDIGNVFDDEWQLLTTHIYIHELNNQTVLISQPFIVDDIGDMGFAVHLNGNTDKIVDLFTGKELSKEEAFYTLKTGDVLYALPESTEELGVNAPDITYLPTKVEIKWNAFSNASEYSVKLFKTTTSTTGKAYTFEEEIITSELSATFEALEENGRYSVIVCALNSDGKEIAVSENFSVFAAKGINADKVDSNNGSFDSILIIVIVAAAVLVIAAVIVVVLVLTKKKK